MDSLKFYQNRNDLLRLIEYFEGLPTDSPLRNHNYGVYGSALKNHNRYQEAVIALTKAIDDYPFNPLFYLYRGISYWSIQLYDSAEIDFSTALWRSRNYDNLKKYQIKADISICKGDLATAKLYYDSTLMMMPDDAELYLKRANVLVMLNQKEDAMKDLDKAVSMHYVTAYTLKAYLNLELGKDSLAMSEIMVVLSQYPNDFDANLLAGKISILRKDPNSTLKYLLKYLGKIERLDLFYFTGFAYYYLAEDEKAIFYLQKVLEMAEDTTIKIGALHLIAYCKDNLSPGSGCEEFKQAYNLGSEEAGRLIQEYCH